MNDDLGRLFREATGLTDPILLRVTRPPAAEAQTHTLELPFGVLGRGEDCHVRLDSSKVSFRHVYLQAIAGKIFAIDLGSRNGTHWPDGAHGSGWLTAEEPLGVGPFSIQLDAGSGGVAAEPLPEDLHPMERYRQQLGPLPQVDLEFLYENAPQPTWSVSRLITLVGRGPQCKLRFESKSISTVHCSLVLTPQGLWVVDLLGKGGILVNDQPVRYAPLHHEDELKVGRYRIGIRYVDEAFVPEVDDNDESAGTAFGDDELQSDLFELSPFEEHVSTAARPLEWLGSIFRIEGAGNTLIVIPVVDGCSFRYAQLQTESNSLRRKFDMREFKHLLMDLTYLHYFGSELIGVLISLARKATDGGGKAALCCASDKMLEVLKNMRLHKLWPHYATREAALDSFEKKT